MQTKGNNPEKTCILMITVVKEITIATSHPKQYDVGKR